MNDIVRCSRCSNTLIDEEFNSHSCYIKPNSSKIVDIDYFVIKEDKQGNTLIITKTLDGMLLTLKKSDELLQRYKINLTAKDVTEPYARFCIVSVG